MSKPKKFSFVLVALILAAAVPIAAQHKAKSKGRKSRAKPEQVKLEIKTDPKVKASVHYGRKRLGFTPLKTELDKDSGPVDIVVKAKGFITLNTRIFTNADTKITLKLTKEEEANTLYGYKEKIPPDAGLLPSDAGVAPPTPGTDLFPNPLNNVAPSPAVPTSP